MKPVLRLAVQKSGRLSDDTMDLLSACGVHFSRPDRRLRAVSEELGIEILFLRDDDIPGYVADGVADAGIAGENVVLEKGTGGKDAGPENSGRQDSGPGISGPGISGLHVRKRLGFSKCRLSIALPRSFDYSGPEDLAGLHIATSYPVLLGQWFEERGVDASIHTISGSVEIAPGIGLSDGICDIVSSGTTLLSNGLKEVEVILRSEAVLVASGDLNGEKAAILDRLMFRLESVLRARSHRYILMNVPNDAVEKVSDILPGMKAPTVMPLAEEGWSSVHSVIPKDEFWDVIQRLKEVGAEGMLVVPIEKMVL